MILSMFGWLMLQSINFPVLFFYKDLVECENLYKTAWVLRKAVNLFRAVARIAGIFRDNFGKTYFVAFATPQCFLRLW